MYLQPLKPSIRGQLATRLMMSADFFLLMFLISLRLLSCTLYDVTNVVFQHFELSTWFPCIHGVT